MRRTLLFTFIIIIPLLIAACNSFDINSISISPATDTYLSNQQGESSEVLLKTVQLNKSTSEEQHISPLTQSQIIDVGEPILIVTGTIQNKHKENTWIDIWTEGYNETGEQVSWTLNAFHLWTHVLLNLETEETGEFTIHLNYSEEVSSIHIYANNYPVPPP